MTQPASAAKLYWSETNPPAIFRANLNGSDIEQLVSVENAPGLQFPSSIALSLDTGKMYWIDSRRIQRANLDGTDIQTLPIDFSYPHPYPSSIVIDAATESVFWTESRSLSSDISNVAQIRRADLNGNNVELFRSLVGYDRPGGITIDPLARVLYWTLCPQVWCNSVLVQYAVMDGSASGVLAERYENTGKIVYDLPGDTALDVRRRDLYWIEAFGKHTRVATIHQSNIDTRITIPIIESFVFSDGPGALDLNSDTDMLYWVESYRRLIRRASLSGQNVENVLTDLGDPYALALDLTKTGDVDGDGATDLNDFAALQNCFTAHALPAPQPPCISFDFDPPDSDVNLADYRIFIGYFATR